MGFELEGLIGERAVFRASKGRFPRLVWCRLSGDLVLVPLTGPLLNEVAAHLRIAKPAEAATQVASAFGALVSHDGPVVHASAFEFGDDGHERYTLWVAGQARWTRGREAEIRRYFAEERGIDSGPGFDIGKHRSESAAERWVAHDGIPHDLDPT